MVPLFAGHFSALLVSIPVGFLVVAFAFVRVAGRTANEWAADATRFVLSSARGRNRFLSGANALKDAADPAAPPPMDLPETLAPLRFLEPETGSGGRFAVVHHPLDNTYTAVAKVRFSGLSLIDSTRQSARVAGWGGLLAALCTENNVFVRVQVCLRTLPEDGTALRRWHADYVVPGAPQLAVANSEALLEASAPAAAQHEAWLAVTMSGARARADIRSAGDGHDGACAVLWRKLYALNDALAAASLHVDSWLNRRELAEVVRTGFDPASAPTLAARRVEAQHTVAQGLAVTGLPVGVEPALAGPVAAAIEWGSYRHDSGISVSYQVFDWPRSHMYATFLSPLLAHQSGSRRAFSLHLEPLGPRAAKRKISRDQTKREVAIRLRERTGQIVPAHEVAERQRVADQDFERAAGHGVTRFVGYVTVTVFDAAELPRACADLESDAAAARLELRRMFTQQDVGFFAAVLPLGMGLPCSVGSERTCMSSQLPSGEGIWSGPVDATSLAEVLAQTGGSPFAPAPQQLSKPRRPKQVSRPRRGSATAFGGRSPVRLRTHAHRGTTAQVQGLYPWLHGMTPPPVGAYIGIDMHTGGAFSCHPIEWLLRGLITNPNLLISGRPGSGKSATLKALALRLMPYGISTFVAGDLKNEYAPLARALGVEPLELGPGLPARLNPLAAGPLGQHIPADQRQALEVHAEIHRRRLTLVMTLLEMRLGRPVNPTEEMALTVAIRQSTGEITGASRLTDPTLPQVYDRLRDPDTEMTSELRIAGDDRQTLRELVRPVTDALGNLLVGTLAGLFDGPSTVELDFDGPLQTVDLSRVSDRGDEP